jgi:threonine dehydratase
MTLGDVGPAEIEAAAERIRPWVRVTPVLSVEAGVLAAVPVLLKLEMTQVSGSFKARGAFNRLLSGDVPAAGVVIASGGNAGLAVAYAARALGVAAVVFVPVTTPEAKRVLLGELGATVRDGGANYAEALLRSTAHAAEASALLVHAYDQPEVIAGQGTLGRELELQARDVDTILVAVGGGGLIGGIALWFQGRTRVVAVETEGCPTLFSALRARAPIDVDVAGLAVDSLGARRVGSHCWAARSLIADSVLVSDDDVLAAQRSLWREARIAVEPGAAAALAALRAGAYAPAPGERVAVILCGANGLPAQ